MIQDRSLLSRVIFLLFPTWQLNSTPWMGLWLERERLTLINTIRAGFMAVIVALPLHYYFVDTPLGLTNDPIWFKYRFGLTALALFFFTLTFIRIFQNVLPARVLFGSFGIIMSYCQVLSMQWYAEVPYFWGILFAVLFSIFLNASIFPSVLYSATIFTFQYSLYLKANIERPLILGAMATSLLLVALIRRKMTDDIALFVQTQENVDIQRKYVEAQKELSDQIQAFLPQKIRERLTRHITIGKMTVLQAMDEVLRVREQRIAVLFSDIRGFTQGSKDLNYLKGSAIPNMRQVTSIVESYDGVPRQIGDLVLSYFDETDEAVNLFNALHAGIQIMEMTERMNELASPSQKIRRYVLIDVGLAEVGNIGGSGSAREITAMGTCVNRLSRIDPITKIEQISKDLGYASIVLTNDAFETIKKFIPHFNANFLDLRKFNLKIRDFPDETKLWFVRSSDPTVEILQRSKSEPNSPSRRVA